jgi:hypothetical protein
MEKEKKTQEPMFYFGGRKYKMSEVPDRYKQFLPGFWSETNKKMKARKTEKVDKSESTRTD